MVLLGVVGCGKQATSTSSQGTSNIAAVKQFIQQEHADIQKINQAFVKESNLFKEVSTKQISYNSFKSSYENVQSQVNATIRSMSSSTAPAGAEEYKKEYISLLNEGTKVFADQEKAILSNGSVDKKQVATVQQELNQFVTDSKVLASKYGLN